jgi:hypothetical protein
MTYGAIRVKFGLTQAAEAATAPTAESAAAKPRRPGKRKDD